jgi:hypothetical protein
MRRRSAQATATGETIPGVGDAAGASGAGGSDAAAGKVGANGPPGDTGAAGRRAARRQASSTMTAHVAKVVRTDANAGNGLRA